MKDSKLKKMKKANSILLLIAAVFIVTACFNLNKFSLYNLSGQYSGTGFTKLHVAAFNESDGQVRLFIPIATDDLAIEKDKESGRNYTKMQLKYVLMESYESKHILDSAGIIYTDSLIRFGDSIFTFDIQYPGDKKYILKLSLTDLNRVEQIDRYLLLDNSGGNSSAGFLMMDINNEIMFGNYAGPGEDFYFRLPGGYSGSVYVSFYQREFPIALPPFMEESEVSFDYKADSVFLVRVQDGASELLSLKQEGFYHFRTDTSQQGGFTVYLFYDGFPGITTTGQMLEPLRYITTKKEYEELAAARELKLAIDQFWISNAGNASRARAMIQKYYGRVEEANIFFSSYLEGWKTDRGLVYILTCPF
jgi:GWxTD domain-containing protein